MLGSNLGSMDQNWGFGVENLEFPRGNNQNMATYFGATRQASWSSLGRVAQWQTLLFWVFRAMGVDPNGSKLILLM